MLISNSIVRCSLYLKVSRLIIVSASAQCLPYPIINGILDGDGKQYNMDAWVV